MKELEYISHVQKLVGNRLSNIKRNGKGVGGRERLTDNITDGHPAKQLWIKCNKEC